jgi:two-component system phosphate regulon response regulator PhoB
MEKVKILVVEDEAPIQELLRFNLEKLKYKVKTADSGEEALKQATEFKPNLILLDIMLPGTDGLEVCKILKSSSSTKNIPIIMLTALCEEADIVTGLELGAVDYITKPFSPRVLLARVKAALRRPSAADVDKTEELISIHNIMIDLLHHRITVDHEVITLTHTEFKVLTLMTSQPGRVFTRYQIVDAVHGEDYPVTDRSVDVQIVGLRKKLGNAGSCIETVRGIGYRIKEVSS